MQTQQNFSPKAYLAYKFLNSLFAGTALGTIFTIYALIPPKVYSVGGISLSIGAWLLTFFYVKLISIKPYKRILLFIEVLPFCYILAFLLFPHTFYGALFIYGIYQISFIFGDYLVRSETLIFSQKALLSSFDKYKQIGYLSGLIVAFIFYSILESLDIENKQAQVYNIHFLLFLLQIGVFITLCFALRDKSIKT
ncbi:hypothetical protein [Helicobacter mesocricetorum]|uniref:hypothetical protein n=1 Tax=Helicobacter mesocricetorum TaxID=87012 RepID=UPI000CF14BA2|nr:hypothetical protein [Helicobacter mesocricetorum]